MLSSMKSMEAGPSNGQMATENIERPLGPPDIAKLNGWQLFEKMGRPKFVVAVCVPFMRLTMRNAETDS